MLTGATGAWLLRSPHTLFPQRGVAVTLLYVWLGHLVEPGPGAHDRLVLLYHLYRVAAVVALTAAAYRFLQRVGVPDSWRAWATAVVLFGGGWDWLGVAFPNVWPLTFISFEAFGVVGTLALPHLVLARALLLWALLAYLRQAVQPRRRWPLQALLWVGGMVLTQGLETVALGTALLTHLLALGWMVRRRKAARALWWAHVRAAAPLLLGAAGVIGYYAWLVFTDPFMAGWWRQGAFDPITPMGHLLAYGWLFPLAWFSARLSTRDGKVEGLWLACWAVVALGLGYLPLPIGRRFVEGGWPALVALALQGTASWAHTPVRRRWARLYWTTAFVGPALLWVGMFRTAWTPRSPAFHPRAEAQAFEALAARACPGDAVLAAYPTGNALPAWAPVRVPLGLEPESVPLDENRARVRAFYAVTTSLAQRQALLAMWDVRWVFWGPHERALGSWRPDAQPVPGLRLRYNGQGYAFYAYGPPIDCAP